MRAYDEGRREGRGGGRGERAQGSFTEGKLLGKSAGTQARCPGMGLAVDSSNGHAHDGSIARS